MASAKPDEVAREVVRLNLVERVLISNMLIERAMKADVRYSKELRDLAVKIMQL